MTVIIAVALTLVAGVGTAVVDTHSPERQAVSLTSPGSPWAWPVSPR